MSRVRTWVHRADRWFIAPEPERRLAIVLTLFSVALAIRIALSPFASMAEIPAIQFDPPIFLLWLSSPPPVWAIVVLQAIGVAAGLCFAARQRPHAAFVVAWLALLLLAGLRASRGKIMHPDTMILLACVPLLFAPRDTRRSGSRVGARYGLPLRTSMAVVAIIYFLTGYQKLATSGIAWVTSDNLRWVMYRATNIYSGHAPGVARWVADRAWLCTLIALSTILFECGAPLTLAFRRLRPLLPIAATGFHTMIWFFYGLDYSMWIASTWILFIEWDTVVDRLRRRVVRSRITAFVPPVVHVRPPESRLRCCRRA